MLLYIRCSKAHCQDSGALCLDRLVSLPLVPRLLLPHVSFVPGFGTRASFVPRRRGRTRLLLPHVSFVPGFGTRASFVPRRRGLVLLWPFRLLARLPIDAHEGGAPAIHVGRFAGVLCSARSSPSVARMQMKS